MSNPRQTQPPPPGTYTSSQAFVMAATAATRTKPEHLLSATQCICRILHENQIPFAIMGGFSLALRGGQRTVDSGRSDLGGSLGAPDDPESASEIVLINTLTGEQKYPVYPLLVSKLGAYFGRRKMSDFNDIMFIIHKYPLRVYDVREQLNREYRQAFVDALTKGTAPPQLLSSIKETLGIV
ncbi:hypothetical protein TESG_01673 [Trichophyton tonsurans CBS 112818]|uniref:Uncharacterized protein n=2 Tax=Trichophyton TaxID=5550 RepID=F2Q182_TRIEC|nr:hypothetical protein TESG_01673 [Trichophyton tonsurans CBS 112818]EGE07900.1 hypothetical protein TEQG_06932 [Trichophyton equinum CBS 127.97]